MRRREFIGCLGGAVALPLSAHAQQTMPVIGFLRSTSAASAARLVSAFRQGLMQAGFVEGKHVTIEYRWADDQLDRLPELANDLIRRQPALIAGSVLAARVLKASTSAIPIVFVGGGDPVRIGLVPSLNRPGGNLTGVVFTSSGLTAKRLEQLHAIVPKSAAIAALFDPHAPETELEPIKDAEEAGRKIGRQVLIMKAADEAELHSSFAEMVQRGAGGLLIGNSPFFSADAGNLPCWRLAMGCRRALPSIASPMLAS